LDINANRYQHTASAAVHVEAITAGQLICAVGWTCHIVFVGLAHTVATDGRRTRAAIGRTELARFANLARTVATLSHIKVSRKLWHTARRLDNESDRSLRVAGELAVTATAVVLGPGIVDGHFPSVLGLRLQIKNHQIVLARVEIECEKTIRLCCIPNG